MEEAHPQAPSRHFVDIVPSGVGGLAGRQRRASDWFFLERGLGEGDHWDSDLERGVPRGQAGRSKGEPARPNPHRRSAPARVS